MSALATSMLSSTSWSVQLASSGQPEDLSRMHDQESMLGAHAPGKPLSTPIRTAGPSLEQIVAKVTARKQLALQEAEGIATSVDDALKEYLLAHSRTGVPACRQAFSQLQNVTPTRTPANTPRSILKSGASSGRKPIPSSVSWSSETCPPAPSPLQFCVPRPAARREIVYETARPSYPLHLLEQSRDASGAGRVSPAASSLARADADQPSASDGSRDRSAYAARYLAGLPPPPSLARTGSPVCTALELAPSSSTSSIASAASATEAPEAHTRLRADAPEFVPGPARVCVREGVPAGGRADDAGRPRPMGPEPGGAGAGNALPRADATS